MDATPPLDTTHLMLPLSRESFLELGSHHQVNVSLRTAKSLTYDPEILKQVGAEFGRIEPVLCMRLIGSERGGSISI